MQKSNEDCYYFLTSTCSKGASCPYRHNVEALTCNVTCPAWKRNNCTDLSCRLRHSIIQRPPKSAGISCFYENTQTGCLKPDCTFTHSRARLNLRNPSSLRPSTTNLVNKDVIKPITSTTVTSSPVTVLETINEMKPVERSDKLQNSSPKVETPLTTDVSSRTISNEAIPQNSTISVNNGHQESAIRSAIDNTSEKLSDEAMCKPTQTRLSANRNVVIAETSSNSTKKTVQGATNRVVVSSDAVNASKKEMDDDDSDIDLDELDRPQDNIKRNSNSVLTISFPCSAPSIANRLFTSTKPTTATNDTKPIRLNRDPLPATKVPTLNAPNSTVITSNGEKTSAGTGLSTEDIRRQSRIERFKRNPIPPPRSVVHTPSSMSPDTVASLNMVQRKRPIAESSSNGSPPSKRFSSQQDNLHPQSTTIGDLCLPSLKAHRPRDRRPSSSSRSSSSFSSSPSPPQKPSPPRQPYSSTTPMDDQTWKNEVDAFLARTSQPKHFSSLNMISPQPGPILSLRAPYIPPLMQSAPPLLQQRKRPSVARYQPPVPRPRILPPKVNNNKPPSTSVANNSSTPALLKTNEQPSAKPVEKLPSKPIEQNPPKPVEETSTKPVDKPISNDTPKAESSTNLLYEDDNHLLVPDEPTDVVDMFAVIDAALFDTDLELM